jgi:hypothetical protein
MTATLSRVLIVSPLRGRAQSLVADQATARRDRTRGRCRRRSANADAGVEGSLPKLSADLPQKLP